MPPGLVYRNALIYELAMFLMYGRHYFARYRAISDLIPPGSSVLDLCCGPAVLYLRYLRYKSVKYSGFDINEKFIRRLIDLGGYGKVGDLRHENDFPTADYVVMQASLYHFLPDPSPLIEQMLQAARKQVIIAEPIRNITSGRFSLLSARARFLTDPGVGNHSLRFTEKTLDEFFCNHDYCVGESFLIKGGREKVFVLNRVE